MLFKSVRKKISGYRQIVDDYTSSQNTHQPQRPRIRSPQPVYSVKRTERSAKASMAGVVTVIRQHHRGSCVFVIFCIHYVCCLAAWASNYPAPSVPQGWNIPSLLLPSFPFLFHQPWEKRENSPAKLSRQNYIERRAQFGRNTFFRMDAAHLGQKHLFPPWVRWWWHTQQFHVDMFMSKSDFSTPR